MLKKLLSSILIIAFITSSLPVPKVFAQPLLGLPEPGTMISLSPAYEPVMIKGLTVHKDNPFFFDFIVDVGQDHLAGQALKDEGEKLIKYFLASLAVPDKDVWVNLSPYEKNRMIPEALGQTDMGRDLLEQDYILKQITASLIYPEKQLGRIFWDKVYTKAREMYGTTQVPVDTFNKVWIVADRAQVFERNQTAFVVDSHMKVMLEEDYLALQKHTIPPNAGAHSIGSQIVRQIILPQLEKEVNQGKNFAHLRQILNSLILANWYKNNLKQALLNQVYANQARVKGINLKDPTVKEQIYEQYLKAYKKGVFNYIKENVTTQGDFIPRKYFSGGFGESPAVANPAMTSDPAPLARSISGRSLMSFQTGIDISRDADGAMAAEGEELKGKKILVVDNDQYQRDDYKYYLELAGATVVEAIEGRQALDVLEREKVDLVITDLQMPGGMGGEELYRIVKKDYPGMKIIVWSGASVIREPFNFEVYSKIKVAERGLIRFVTGLFEDSAMKADPSQLSILLHKMTNLYALNHQETEYHIPVPRLLSVKDYQAWLNYRKDDLDLFDKRLIGKEDQNAINWRKLFSILKASPHQWPFSIQRLVFPSPMKKGPYYADNVPAYYYLPYSKPKTSKGFPVAVVLSFMHRDAVSHALSVYYASQGIAVLQVVMPMFGERSLPGTEGIDTPMKYAMMGIDPQRFQQYIVQSIADTLEAVHWLSSRPEIDHSNISVIGQSMNGSVAASAYAYNAHIRNLIAITPIVNYAGTVLGQRGNDYEVARNQAAANGHDEQGMASVMDGLNLDQLGSHYLNVGRRGVVVLVRAQNDELVLPNENDAFANVFKPQLEFAGSGSHIKGGLRGTIEVLEKGPNLLTGDHAMTTIVKEYSVTEVRDAIKAALSELSAGKNDQHSARMQDILVKLEQEMINDFDAHGIEIYPKDQPGNFIFRDNPENISEYNFTMYDKEDVVTLPELIQDWLEGNLSYLDAILTAGNRPVILVADDNILERRMVSSALKAHGYVVVTSWDGQDAFDKLSNVPALNWVVVSDFNMPRMDGRGLVKAIRQSEALKDVPFILRTSYMDEYRGDIEGFYKGFPILQGMGISVFGKNLKAHNPEQKEYPLSMIVKEVDKISGGTDRAMKAGSGDAVNGGIDLTAASMNMEVSKEGSGVEMDIDPAMIARIKREGIESLTPVIFKITPVANVWSLVGLAAPQTSP